MNNHTIGWIFLTVVILSIALPIRVHKFYKGRTRKVKIIKKRETERELVNFSKTKFNAGNYVSLKNKTIDLIYDGRKTVHTLNCSEKMFKKLHTGNEYIVIVRLNRIVKIVKKAK